jgi:hypothetical protein
VISRSAGRLDEYRCLINSLRFIHAVLPGADERKTNENDDGFDRNNYRIKAMFVVRHGNGIYQRNQKCEKNTDAEGKSQHHKNSAHTPSERSQKTPPIKMRMKIEDAHSAAKLPPTVFAGEKNGRANQNEDETDARPQKQETGFAIFSQKF